MLGYSFLRAFISCGAAPPFFQGSGWEVVRGEEAWACLGSSLWSPLAGLTSCLCLSPAVLLGPHYITSDLSSQTCATEIITTAPTSLDSRADCVSCEELAAGNAAQERVKYE